MQSFAWTQSQPAPSLLQHDMLAMSALGHKQTKRHH